MSHHRRTTLFVAGISSHTRARDLAYEFERYGRLVRCDIPAPRGVANKPYAFVEFEDDRDAEDAYYEMQNRKVDGYPLNIQWAKNAPSRSWRYDDRRERSRSPPRRPRGGRSRSRSPPRVKDERPRSRSPIRDDVRADVDPVRDDRSPVRRSPSPAGNGHRSPSPRGDVDDRARSPSPRD
ncbi:hypothetical protein HDU86_006103 [Geranomyces michiganensis]|nr:hypothetical protein HDU86_006103 [Geranomyces michiganensis]